MPKKLINDYIFYKIVCISDDIDLCYVGSTANWKERQKTHKSICNNENNKSYNLKIYKTIRANGGWENFKMVQVGTRQQLTKREAEQIEEEYRQELKANMNMKKCFRTEEQKQEQHKEYSKNYYEENKDKLKEKQQNYYEANKDKMKENQQNYYQANKDKIKENREANKDKIKEKFNCECGCIISKANLLRHQKSRKHINNTKTLSNQYHIYLDNDNNIKSITEINNLI